MIRNFFSSLFCFVSLIALFFFNNPGWQSQSISEPLHERAGILISKVIENPGVISKTNPNAGKSLATSDGSTNTIYIPLLLNDYGPQLLPVRGLYVSFERRGSGSGYYSGDAITNFTNYDDVVGHTIAQEISLQLDQMKQMGVNTITYELRSADPTNTGSFDYPACNIDAVLGLQYPQPTPSEITNLQAFLDMLHTKGIKLFLRLVNTHMEEAPPVNNELWLGTILNAVKDKPALDLVVLDGTTHAIDTNGDDIDDACGIPAEPPLWMGPGTNIAGYVKWAIGYAHSLGLAYKKLSAEAIVGDYYSINNGPSGPRATDYHLWDPIYVLKGILDDLSVPTDQRTYAISFGEHRKCSTARQLPCTDTNPHAWAVETITGVFNTIGRNNGARVVASEMSFLSADDATWNSELTLESLVWIMKNYGVDGGCFYHWTSFNTWEEFDPAISIPIKQRGTEFLYNPLKDVLEKVYTVGQSSYLDLTPDTVPPVFIFMGTSGSNNKGETITISAGLGETHLFVTADISVVDTSRTIPVVLLDQGDGTYARDVTINLWSEAANGIKTFPMTAMDFWSNGTTGLGVAWINNPPPSLDSEPPDDNFAGITIDDHKWQPEPINGGIISQNDRLILKTSSAFAYSTARASSVWNFTGDFDAQADFQIGEGWGQPVTEQIDGANYGVIIAGQTYLITRQRRANGDDVILAWSSTGSLLGEAVSSALTGKFRVIRNGTTLILLFDVGSGWRKLAQTAVPASSAQIYMGNGSINASQAFTTYLDNFHINSGLTNYSP